MPFRVIGPVGTKALMESLEKAYAGDIEVRLAEGKADGNIKPTIGFQIQAQEFAEDGGVHDRDGVRVTAFKVDHGKEITPAFGYRIDYKNRSVIISGDTRKDAKVIQHGQGVDVLVHEVALPPRWPNWWPKPGRPMLARWKSAKT